MSTTTTATHAVSAAGIEKRFGSTRALHDVSVSIDSGRCLGLVGRNGAGKSTLVSILCGLVEPDAGEVRFDDQPAPPLSDLDGWRTRISTVFQHRMVVPQLTVAENVFLGRPLTSGGRVDWGAMRGRTREIIDSWGFEISPNARCETLNVEQLQIVEIARALATGARCVLLDEPTASLERTALERLFARIKQLVQSGVAVLYISHHLEEVFEVCDDVTVLRDGEVVLNAPIGELNEDQMVTAMVGDARSVELEHQARRSTVRAAGDTGGLTVSDLQVQSASGPLASVSLRITAGEVLGVTGLLSAGVGTLGRAVAGVVPFQAGTVAVDGRKLSSNRRSAAQDAGIAYVPEDRHREGYVGQLGIAENATMTVAERIANRLGFLTPAQRRTTATPLTEQLSLVSSGLEQHVSELSGGNQQKVTVARALVQEPQVIVAVTPTRGVDVASKALLLGALQDAAREHDVAVLLCTDELDDLVVADRVIVLFHGEVFREFTDRPFDREQLIAATEGLKPEREDR